MKITKIVQNNLWKIIWYSNTLEYFGRIYSFAKIFDDFSWGNLFGYSFVIFLSCRIYSDIHLSNIYGNKHIPIFIRPKICYLSHTAWKLDVQIASLVCSIRSIRKLPHCYDFSCKILNDTHPHPATILKMALHELTCSPFDIKKNTIFESIRGTDQWKLLEQKKKN